ncbi:hypothetical protein [Thalassobaculum sp.]|uniref:hypothetical protein n=1 Tax=Thalassobaculum sp. TaxID=2022740 RepID=UPI0032EAE842
MPSTSRLPRAEREVLRACYRCHQREYDYRTRDPDEIRALRRLADRGLVIVPSEPGPGGWLPASYHGPEVL